VVPSIFSPPYRKKDNFAYSDQIILDFDHLSSNNLSPDKVKDSLSKDPRVELMFTSPSGDGVKVFLRLSKRITDRAQYSAFYKIFGSQFAKAYNLAHVWDAQTNDVTRACFLSVDLFAYFNPNCEPVGINEYVDFENITEVLNQEKNVEKEQKALYSQHKKTDEHKQQLPNDIFIEIKKKLDPNYKPRVKKNKIYIVPQELNTAEEKILQAVKKFNINVLQVRNINYGKQFLFEYQSAKAEINVFYGKKGFSVVKTVRNFNNIQLQQLLVQIIEQTLID
jgi:hypothetical protein